MPLAEIIRRYLIYGLSGPIIALNLWVLSQIFRYFEGLITFVVLAAILAMILDYLVRFLEKLRLSRTLSVLVVLFLFLTLVAFLGITLIPILSQQVNQLFEGLPGLLEASDRNLSGIRRFIAEYNLPFNIEQIISQLSTQIQNAIAGLPELAINTAGQVFTTVFLVVLAFYMLIYGERFWQGIVSLLPVKIGKALNQSLKQQFHQFFLSQLLLALVMVIFLAPCFLTLQINLALLFAFVIGLFELVPLFGATIGIGIVTLLVWGLQGIWPAVWVAGVSIFFQQITDNVIAPKLRGEFAGLNPIWIFIALLIGGRVAGFLGVVLAMPIAGTIKSTIEQMQLFQRYRNPPADPPIQRF
jgi:predicted PurR-regulated permease PerM